MLLDMLLPRLLLLQRWCYFHVLQKRTTGGNPVKQPSAYHNLLCYFHVLQKRTIGGNLDKRQPSTYHNVMLAPTIGDNLASRPSTYHHVFIVWLML